MNQAGPSIASRLPSVMASLAGAMTALFLCGCAGPSVPQPVTWTTTLHSNIENTKFEANALGRPPVQIGGFSVRPASDTLNAAQGWIDIGTGKYVPGATISGYAPFEVRATAPGYQPKLYTMTTPMQELRFTYLKEDKLAAAPVAAMPSVAPAAPPAYAPMPAAPSGPGNQWALIIGIAQYQHANEGLSNLLYADKDARSFAQALENLGWSAGNMKVLINEQATQRNINIALESWLTKARPEDTIVLYWSGHGYPDPEDPNKVYFACHDTEIDIPATGLRMDRVRSTIEERRVRNVFVFADTCHAGKLITRSSGEKGLSVVPQLTNMDKTGTTPEGWVFMVGADTDRLAIEHSSWSNGAFTHCLLKGLGGEADGFQSSGPRDGVVNMGELRAYMQTAMPSETQSVLGAAKHPVITTSSGSPDIWTTTLAPAR